MPLYCGGTFTSIPKFCCCLNLSQSLLVDAWSCYQRMDASIHRLPQVLYCIRKSGQRVTRGSSLFKRCVWTVLCWAAGASCTSFSRIPPKPQRGDDMLLAREVFVKFAMCSLVTGLKDILCLRNGRRCSKPFCKVLKGLSASTSPADARPRIVCPARLIVFSSAGWPWPRGSMGLVGSTAGHCLSLTPDILLQRAHS